jgi:hypothetical protein
VRLFDIAPDGRVLLGNEVADRRVDALFRGATTPEDVSLRADSTSQWISDDGSTITISDQAASSYQTYLIRAGTNAVRLGDGQAYGMSPDGRWVLSLPVVGSPVLLHATGAGETRALANSQKISFDVVGWLPDSRRVMMFGAEPGHAARGYVQTIDGGEPRPFTKEGVGAQRWWSLPVSPDGTRVVAQNPDGSPGIYRVDGGTAETVRGLKSGEEPVQWTPDGQGLLVAHRDGIVWIVERLELTSGRRTPVREIRARDAAGLRLSIFAITPDSRFYVHSYSRLLSDLYVIEGFR